ELGQFIGQGNRAAIFTDHRAEALEQLERHSLPRLHDHAAHLLQHGMPSFAHSWLKRLSTAVSVTDTARTWAREANCSKLACSCCWKPNTKVCTHVAPSNLRCRTIQPVSRANSLARLSSTCCNCCSTYATLVISRLLSDTITRTNSVVIMSD